jgi:hypothetical protein
MKAQCLLLGLLSPVVLLPIAADAEVVDRSLFAFGDSDTGPNVTATQIGNVTTIRSVNTPVPIEIAIGDPLAVEGIYNLTATSVGAATQLFTPGEFIEDYTGSFSVTGVGGFNYLSGTFSEPLIGIDASANVINENQAQISQLGLNKGSWSFTSDISGLASSLNEDDQSIYFLAFFNASNIGITDGTFSSFTANGSGAFETSGPAVVAAPEPSTWAMMLIGFVGLGYAGLRKARATAAFV